MRTRERASKSLLHCDECGIPAHAHRADKMRRKKVNFRATEALLSRRAVRLRMALLIRTGQHLPMKPGVGGKWQRATGARETECMLRERADKNAPEKMNFGATEALRSYVSRNTY